MFYEWDHSKALSNFKKHRITFDLAVTVFYDPLHLSILDFKNIQEERWVTIGLAANQCTLVVVHTFKSNGDEEIRIISARKATTKEKKQYEEGI